MNYKSLKKKNNNCLKKPIPTFSVIHTFRLKLIVGSRIFILVLFLRCSKIDVDKIIHSFFLGTFFEITSGRGGGQTWGLFELGSSRGRNNKLEIIKKTNISL